MTLSKRLEMFGSTLDYVSDEVSSMRTELENLKKELSNLNEFNDIDIQNNFEDNHGMVDQTVQEAPISDEINYRLTVATDRLEYDMGGFVKIMGTAKPNSPISISVEPENGDHISYNTSTNEDGEYSVNLAIREKYATGKWAITATDGRQNASTIITVFQP